jgi:predicted Zn-dependent protease
MRDYFDQLAQAVCTSTLGLDRVSLYLAAESADFIRFNRAAVRQATHVEQRYGTVTVVAGARSAQSTVTLSGDVAADADLLLAERETLAEQLPFVPEDSYLLLPDTVVNSERTEHGDLPSAAQVIDAVAKHAEGFDLVGFYAGGPMVRGFADSRGQRNWHSVESFHFDWCLYSAYGQARDKAVKTAYAGTHWQDDELAGRLAAAKARVALLAQPARSLEPGEYRAYFTPVAMAELLGTLAWGGFGLKDVKTGVSTLIKAYRDQVLLSPHVSLTEATGSGISPCFTPSGFIKPDSVVLVRAGQAVGTLNSPRSAREYNEAANGAADFEGPESQSMAPGDLPESQVLAMLGSGVYVSNLWYLNYSDRQACRMTGMTRFACFWVENGELVAPINVMRFDDSFLRMFGEGLVALTDHAELVPDSDTYGGRQLRSITTPGAIVEGLRFTL